jgi:hypothetical protein
LIDDKKGREKEMIYQNKKTKPTPSIL